MTGYPPSRIVKKDWICAKCSNILRNTWSAKNKVVRKEAKNLFKIKSLLLRIITGLSLLPGLPNKPKCPFCDENLRPNRKHTDRGRLLNWYCTPCNEIITTKEV